MLHILYLVHDLSDPAVRRRVSMLLEGGARITVAGFRRTGEPPANVDGLVPIDLGATHDGKFAQRLMAVAKAAATLGSRLGSVARPDLVIARNLEMLALAQRAKAAFAAPQVPVVYECLDIHRLVLRGDPVGAALRGVERYLGRDVKALVTSSPAFMENYFGPYGQISAPVELVENKFFDPKQATSVQPVIDRPPAPPWRIGWFGALRCRRSLELLAGFTRHMRGRFEVALRGRPALTELPDFHSFVASEPYLSFHGPYKNPEDMAMIYGDVHFSWAIDFFERGRNSEWLLPNRLYEGCRFGAVPIAMRGTEIARFLDRRGIGVLLPRPTSDALEEELGGMEDERLARLQKAVRMCDPGNWAYDSAYCRSLVARLSGLAGVQEMRPAEALASRGAGI